jgi:uncharacterized membrane protein
VAVAVVVVAVAVVTLVVAVAVVVVLAVAGKQKTEGIRGGRALSYLVFQHLLGCNL